MSGAANKTPIARYKLIKTFFWIVRASGCGEENARAVIERLYKVDSLRKLTTDELARVVDELAASTGVELRKPLPKEPKLTESAAVVQGGQLIELPTRDQLAMVEYLSDRMNMSQETLQHLIGKAGGDPALSLLSARTLIEILKAMHGRGWKEKPATQPPSAAARGH